MSDTSVRLQALYLYPVKSCAGIAVDEALLVETGLDLDRAWMVVDADGLLLTQREHPRMALVRPAFRGSNELVLRAPGMLALHLALDTVDAPTRATVREDTLPAYGMGALADQWFSDFLGVPARLVRFDPEQKRVASRRWTGEIEARTAFSDAFPLLVTSTASLAEVNRRLQAAGHAPVGIERFRPNLVLDGLDAHGEDHLHEVRFETGEGPIVLRIVKPCTRCSIPDVDPASGVKGHAVGDTLAGYRADARMDGALTFGMNAVIVEGFDRVLRVGLEGSADWRFD